MGRRDRHVDEAIPAGTLLGRDDQDLSEDNPVQRHQLVYARGDAPGLRFRTVPVGGPQQRESGDEEPGTHHPAARLSQPIAQGSQP